MTYVYFVLIVFTSAFLQATLGFGFPIICMAFLPTLFDYHKAIVLVQCIATVSTLFLSIKYFKHINWKVLTPVLVPALIIGLIITYFSFSISSKALSIMLGVVLFLLAVYSFVFANKIHVKANTTNGIIMGVIGGVGNGLFSISGPTTALYLLPALDDKVAYLACMQAFFFLSNSFLIVIRILKGSLQFEDIGTIAIGWVAMLAGTMVGLKCFKRLKGETFKKVIYAFIGVNGLWIIISKAFGIA